jgi:hypothetical protein
VKTRERRNLGVPAVTKRWWEKWWEAVVGNSGYGGLCLARKRKSGAGLHPYPTSSWSGSCAPVDVLALTFSRHVNSGASSFDMRRKSFSNGVLRPEELPLRPFARRPDSTAMVFVARSQADGKRYVVKRTNLFHLRHRLTHFFDPFGELMGFDDLQLSLA